MEKLILVLLLSAFSPLASAHCGSCGVGGESSEEHHAEKKCVQGEGSCPADQQKSTAAQEARSQAVPARPQAAEQPSSQKK